MLLSCPLCSKPHFEGVDSLRTTLVNVATAPLTCPVCQETLKGLDKLTIHLFGHVNSAAISSKGYSLSACEDQSLNAVKLDHLSTTTEEDSSPALVTLPSPSELVSVQSEEVLACDICSFTFMDRNILEMHQQLLHQTSADEKTGKCSYHCHLCSKRFRMRGSLMVHLRVAHYGFTNHINLPPDLLNRAESGLSDSLEPDGMNKSLRAQDFKQWSCDVCAKMFTTKYFLKKHKRLHTGEMPYSCTICNKSFTFQQSYHKHMLYHSSEKPYVCNECGRAFKEHSTLQNHARIHSGERPFGCDICGKRFRQRVSYLVHTRIHTGVMPYKCTACQKSFRYKVSQRSHKCPMNPPGSVIRIADNEASSGPNFAPLIAPAESSKIPNCIMSVDYETGNINLIRGDLRDAPENTLNNVDCLKNQRDIYSGVISPILNEVESLCLDNRSPIHHPTAPIEDNMQIIRDKCLEELFQ
ncbi:zinc finger protein ZFP2 isoform X1 [Dendroctonus ponderosae]|uniref:zinc finger protein ZFP2 isoform X1 n=1 Tax=Dendroctonus ponderosae TaxID=77166 RepID=UPI0020355DDF|nr:zinc finger protein ZFP2 isoform X1 [Dendroctonus ponderosae]